MIDSVFLNGTVGVGKSSVAEALSVLEAKSEHCHAVIDLDHIRRAWPAPDGDRFNHELEMENLRDLVVNYRRAGVEHFILAGVVEEAGEVPRYEAALQSRGLLICRLEADPATLTRRLRLRHGSNPAELDWHLGRAGELAAILRAASVDHLIVDNSTGSPMATATIVQEKAGW
ncbi:AAA family ATPase [Cryobacterium sp. TMT3-29-2]|uniref:AAA family ATPase n=1 Tax=Cryobacterium sp. TMT3-29-2 TaxID=2555867 RepID=UPI0018E06D44|nr:AAA family ATPase [Cryobacterium sp. TMT3-29-2]